jgi:hypothetical protein
VRHRDTERREESPTGGQNVGGFASGYGLGGVGHGN